MRLPSISSWSWLLVSILIPATALARVVISEVQWAGSDLSTADEWVELQCSPDASMDANATGECLIGGWSITYLDAKGIEQKMVTFPPATALASGAYVLLSNYVEPESRISIHPDFVATAVTLPNTKLLLRLRDASGSVVDTVDDGIGDPFAGLNQTGTGGIKAAMERIDLLREGDAPDNWITAKACLNTDQPSPVRGTPGARYDTLLQCGGTSSLSSSSDSRGSATALSSSSSFSDSRGSATALPSSSSSDSRDTFAAPRIRISEILPDPIGSDVNEWIELQNFSDVDQSAAGLTLKTGTGTSVRSFAIPVTATASLIPAGGFLLLPAALTHLSLRNAGDSLAILQGSTVLDAVTYPAAYEGVSYGRNASGLFTHLCSVTPGLPNDVHLPHAEIIVQSGEREAQGSTTLNLQITLSSGASLAGAKCHVDFADGYASDSCNPPSHAMSTPGTYAITASLVPACGVEARSTLAVTVHPVLKNIKKKKLVQDQEVIGASRETGCRILSRTGVTISEIYPAPSAKDSCVKPGMEDYAPLLSMTDPLKCEEWIELHNVSSEGVSLCGWQLDDGEKGSKPFSIGERSIAPGEYLLIPKSVSMITLNDAGDSARLLAPVRYQGYRDRDHYYSGVTLIDSLSFSGAIHGQSLAMRADGAALWSPYPTPGRENSFMTAAREYPRSLFQISAALPNPAGEDEGHEWIEIRNLTTENQSLNGWSVQSGKQSYPLRGVWLRPFETRRMGTEDDPIMLKNADGNVELRDPDGYIASVLGWKSAKEGEILRSRPPDGKRITVHVLKVIDGDTFDVEILDIKDPNLPPSILHRWSAMEIAPEPAIRVRLIGVNAPEIHDRSGAILDSGIEAKNFTSGLIEKKNIDLIFDTEIWDKYERVLPYAVLPGTDDLLQSALLRSGNAVFEPQYSYTQKSLFAALEGEAQEARLGMWASESSSSSAYAVTVSSSSDASSSEPTYSTLFMTPLYVSGDTPRVSSLRSSVSSHRLPKSSSTISTQQFLQKTFPVRWRMSSENSSASSFPFSGALLDLTMYSGDASFETAKRSQVMETALWSAVVLGIALLIAKMYKLIKM